ncbi:hypothetical protein EDD99_5057 [Streptomyces sp. 846.5]|nr:hypothetical protein [Streptomyces sp. 846.5]TDU06498.1 hypothetical protein EDD99_5057 [Streptomyces sp. 846.5]
MLDETSEGFEGFPEDLDPQSWAWIPGVDYAAGWRTAKDAADDLNAALKRLKIWPWEFRAVADTDAQGNGWVRIVANEMGARKVTTVLEQLAEQARQQYGEDGQGAA